MKSNVKTSLLALFVVSLITLGTYMVQAEEGGVLPPEPIIEVVEIIPPPAPELETETELLPAEIVTELGSSTPDTIQGNTVTELPITIDDIELIPTDEVNDEVALESEIPAEENLEPETAEAPASVVVPENVPVFIDPRFPYLLEDSIDEHLPTAIQECFGGGFRDFSRPFASPGECLQYVRSL